MADPLVVLAATPRPWAGALHAHAADHGGLVVRSTVLTAGDARDERCDVLLVDDITSFLSASLVAELHDRGRQVLGVHDPLDPDGVRRLDACGVDGLVATDAGPPEMVQAVRALARRGPGSGSGDAAARRAPALERVPGVPASGRIIGVTGPTGGVGVTEIAIELAALLGGGGHPTVLVDADELGPSHAQRLQLALQPNLLGAVDAQRRSADLAAGLHPLSSRNPLSALPGMSVPEDWSCVPSGALLDVARSLSRTHRAVVIDLGHCPEPVETAEGMRFGHAASVAAACTDLVLVSTPTPTAIARTIGLRSRLHLGSATVTAMLNRDPGDRFVRRQSIEEVASGTGAASVAVLPEDGRVGRAAWDGTRVASGRFTRQVRAAADAWGWRQ